MKQGMILKFEGRGKEPGTKGDGTLGAVVVEDINSKAHVTIADGFDEAQRKDIWERWPKFSKQIVEYKLNRKKVPIFVKFIACPPA